MQKEIASFVQICAGAWLIPGFETIATQVTSNSWFASKPDKVKLGQEFNIAMIRSVLKELCVGLDVGDDRLLGESEAKRLFGMQTVDMATPVTTYCSATTFVDRNKNFQVQPKVVAKEGLLALVNDTGDVVRILYNLLNDIAGHTAEKYVIGGVLPVTVKVGKTSTREVTIGLEFAGELTDEEPGTIGVRPMVYTVGKRVRGVGKVGARLLLQRIWQRVRNTVGEVGQYWAWKRAGNGRLRFQASFPAV